MIKVMCQTPEVIRLGELTPFQGDLKRRTSKDISALASSIKDEGLLMPFAVWRHEGVNSLLDGPGRYSALTELALHDNEIATTEELSLSSTSIFIYTVISAGTFSISTDVVNTIKLLPK